MKGMSNTLYIVVAAVVIVVTAVVVLVIFQAGITPALGITEAKSICQTQFTTACATFGQKPPTWNVQNMKVVKDSTTTTKSCSQIMTENGGKDCECVDRVVKGCVPEP